MRWTVDEPDDLAFVRAVYSHFSGRDDFSWRDDSGSGEIDAAACVKEAVAIGNPRDVT